jgi:hypothetical protein
MATPATVAPTVTVKDEDGFVVASATVTIFNASGAVAGSGTTDASGIFTDDLDNTEPTPDNWSYLVEKTGYLPAAGGLVFTADAECEAETWLTPDPAPPS